MPIVNCGSCGAKVKVPESRIGGADKCPACAGELFPGRIDPSRDPGRGESIANQFEGAIEAARLPAWNEGIAAALEKIDSHVAEILGRATEAGRPKEYKVLRIDSHFMTASVKPEKIENLLNQCARDGWIVKTMAEFNTPGLLTSDGRAFLIVLERDYMAPDASPGISSPDDDVPPWIREQTQG